MRLNGVIPDARQLIVFERAAMGPACLSFDAA